MRAKLEARKREVEARERAAREARVAVEARVAKEVRGAVIGLESVRSTPFYLISGYHPRLAELLDLPQKVQQAHEFVKGMKQAVEQARQCLARAQKRMKSYQDNKRREALYLPASWCY
ncbi:hypothetical protein QJQ45_015864 [Haematococcus lacustris]|nr:hypothetical protein QJQ45_001787 [Haematococcus lacustris]KAJ9510393.1 hypothetical protein QJQ45_015864 [Haematococcus lacustris]